MNYQAPLIEWKTSKFGVSYANTVTHSYRIDWDSSEKRYVCSYYNTRTNESDKKWLDSKEALKAWVETIHYPSALRKAGFEPVSEPLSDTLKWFELAVPNPTWKNKSVQLGVHFEEILEMLSSLVAGSEVNGHDSLSEISWAFKNCPHSEYEEVESLIDKNEFLDSLCDQIVTALGVGYMFGFDMKGALAEVIRSNFSKFENGKPVFDENGKIKKGKDYTQPQLEGFI